MTKFKETIQSEKLYKNVAGRYDRVFERAILSEGRLTDLARRELNGKSVLDLACGNGRWLERFAPYEYVGLDLNKEMLAEARARYPECRFIRGDMTNIPFADESFDGVMSMFGAMGHLPLEGQQLMVKEVFRVLAPGGTAIFTNGNMWSPFALPVVLKGSRVRLEGVSFKVHSSTPKKFRELLSVFDIIEFESYDYSYLPMTPLKFGACLLNRDYKKIYAGLMNELDNCRYIPTLRWFGKQLLAICRKP